MPIVVTSGEFPGALMKFMTTQNAIASTNRSPRPLTRLGRLMRVARVGADASAATEFSRLYCVGMQVPTDAAFATSPEGAGVYHGRGPEWRNRSYAMHSKCIALRGVWVRVPPPACARARPPGRAPNLALVREDAAAAVAVE